MTRNFDDWIAAYVEHTSATEAPTEMHIWTAISTIAGVLRRQVWIDQNTFQWTPNFYIILVGPPGVVTKSTTINVGMGLLRQVEGVEFGPTSMTWQALTADLEKALRTFDFIDENGEEAFMSSAALTIEASELGVFLRPEDDGLISVLTDLWDGKLTEWKRTTRTQGEIKIVNPWLNIIGATTPSWLRQNFPEYMVTAGLTSRIIFVWGEKKQRFIAYPSQIVQPAKYKETERKLVEDLQQMAELRGPYLMTDEAIAWGTEWYRKLWTTTSELDTDRLSGYKARKQAMLHKLAMVQAAARSDRLVIEKEHLERADTLIELAEPNMKKVFDSIGVVVEAVHSAEILSYIKAGGGIIKKSELIRLCRNVMENRQIREAVETLKASGEIKTVRADGEIAYVLTEVLAQLSDGKENSPEQKLG